MEAVSKTLIFAPVSEYGTRLQGAYAADMTLPIFVF